MADTVILPGPKPGGNLPEGDNALKVATGTPATTIEVKPDEGTEAIAIETHKPCPNHPNNPETIRLQGDPRIRCAWCHTVLD